ncbi:hypothetical protein PIROE2DRAFT_61377 [Piromyces sp. E2]|nr:hypothetical protein PIROE2DRAFT_61377 [Piromyces sp. E2]|eukprot:OUM63308.1 hypothetical protein PIROE2DRAFT_61377 [Piromyces sp. E2]
MPKILYTENISQYNNPLPFPNYLNTLSLLTDSSTSSIRKFFNANKSISEALLITLISVIQEGIAYQLANHSNIKVDNNSKSYTNNTNFYCCKGVPIKRKETLETSATVKKRSSSFSYSRIYKNSEDNVNDKSEYIIKDDNRNIIIDKNNNENNLLKKSKLSRSFSSSNLEYSKGKSNLQYTSAYENVKAKNNIIINGSHLKYSINEDLSESSDNSSIDLSNPNGSKSINKKQLSSTITEEIKQTSSIKMDHDSIDSEQFRPSKDNSKISVFILLKNLLNMLDIFKSLNFKKQKQAKPFNSVESLDDKEKWEEFNRIYNEAMYNLKAEEYYKNKSLIFKYCTGLNSVQGCYFDIDDNNDEVDNTGINSMSILDEKIRENSNNRKTDILSRIKKDTLTRAEIRECGEYMRRVGVYRKYSI